MKIALIGYGRMGHMIEEIALARGNEITCRIDKDNTSDFDSAAFAGSDVAIEFSTPATAEANILKCFERGVPVVSGTTAWVKDGRLEQMQQLCAEGRGTLMWASNYSIGVNVFMAVNRYLARIMDKLPQYTPYMTETHHIHKLDHPSGTAISLAEDVVRETGRVEKWSESPESGAMVISHIREAEVPGIHTIKWDSPVDDITITHSAKSRAGFALGAVMAAEWLASRRGYHTIDEMMQSITHVEK